MKYFEKNSEKIQKELLSWKIKILGQNTYYKAKKISIQPCSIKNYQQNLEPLFLEEFRAQLGQILKFNSSPIGVSRGQIVKAFIKNGKFIIEVYFPFDKLDDYHNGDFVILIRNSNKKCTPDFSFGQIFGKTEQNEKKILIEVSLKSWKNFREKKDDIKFSILRKISNLKSILREYKIMKNLHELPKKLTNYLFSNSKIKFSKCFSKKLTYTKTHLDQHFNLSQIEGIVNSFFNTLTMIQGPPGTGKTRTILGIICLISSGPKKIKIYENFVSKLKQKSSILENLKIRKRELSFFFRERVKNLNRSKCHKIWRNKKLRPKNNQKRIIVCAFSNAAIDENTARITFGLPMKTLKKIEDPFWALRLGPNYKFFLDHMTLDSLALIIASDNDKAGTIWDSIDILKKSRALILKKAKIVYTTLSCAAFGFLEKFKKREALLIDEAAQAVEISTIGAIKQSCEKLILIGDVQQLPATVFSQSSIDLFFERSLFKRLQQQNFPIVFLETQYRMHPQISSFISRKFYNNGLKDAPHVGKIQNFHFLRCFGPMIFFDVSEGFDKYHHNSKNSWCNIEEIRVISLILRSLICLFSNLNLRSFGYIASYKGQLLEIHERGIIKKNDFKGQINTVDGFQGREKNIIFFSSVRAKIDRGIGFLSDCRRMNVAFTRAKFSLWGIGKTSTLQKDPSWFEAILDFRKRGLFFSIKKPLERSNRRLIYWNSSDERNFSEDGEKFSLLNFFLIKYIKSILFE